MKKCYYLVKRILSKNFQMEKFVLIVSGSICLLGPGEQEDIGLYNKGSIPKA
jgi:hypothetical protein